MTQAPYYHATLCLRGSLIVTKDEQRGGMEVVVGLGDTRVPIGVKRRLAALLEAKSPEGEQGVILWPRTDKEGLLGNGTQLALYKDAGELSTSHLYFEEWPNRYVFSGLPPIRMKPYASLN